MRVETQRKKKKLIKDDKAERRKLRRKPDELRLSPDADPKRIQELRDEIAGMDEEIRQVHDLSPGAGGALQSRAAPHDRPAPRLDDPNASGRGYAPWPPVSRSSASIAARSFFRRAASLRPSQARRSVMSAGAERSRTAAVPNGS